MWLTIMWLTIMALVVMRPTITEPGAGRLSRLFSKAWRRLREPGEIVPAEFLHAS
jgi:hypothetical protein